MGKKRGSWGKGWEYKTFSFVTEQCLQWATMLLCDLCYMHNTLPHTDSSRQIHSQTPGITHPCSLQAPPLFVKGRRALQCCVERGTEVGKHGVECSSRSQWCVCVDASFSKWQCENKYSYREDQVKAEVAIGQKCYSKPHILRPMGLCSMLCVQELLIIFLQWRQLRYYWEY